MKKTILALTSLALFITACAPGSALPLGEATATPTPFLPMTADGTPVVDEPVVVEAPIEPQAGLIPVAFDEYTPPGMQSDIDLPAPVGRFVQPEGQINILLMGSDQRPNDGGFRTDVILLLTLNPNGHSASLTSFPRDLYVYQPGWRVDRINSAYPRGGAQMMGETMEYNFGVKPDHYMLVNFWNFEQIIDTLGGVTVNVAQGITDERDGPGDFSVPAGAVQMDGETALWYVRSRGSSSDFDRTRREQEVLVAIFQRLFSIDALTRAPELFDQYNQMVTTDLQIGDLLPLIPLAAELGIGGGNMSRYAVGPGEVNSFTTSGGGAVLRPVYEAVLDIMRQALNIPA
jgi:LCP family protein required for cell wall assembly